MKITITNYDKTYSAEYDNDSDVESVADMFKGLLVSMGYHPSNVDELFNTEYKWFTQEERDENRQGHLKDDKYNEGYAKGWDEAKHQDKVQKFQDNLYNQEDDMFK
jgi:hypothetical protein